MKLTLGSRESCQDFLYDLRLERKPAAGTMGLVRGVKRCTRVGEEAGLWENGGCAALPGHSSSSSPQT